MALYIQTNVSSMNAQRNLSTTSSAMSTTFARLSSGYRINSAADDAAGLGISTSMTAQIKSFTVAERNANDGISMVQTADAAAGQTAGLLTRMRELSVQSMNGVLTTNDRANLNTEFQSLSDEIDRIANTTKFNSKSLSNGTLATSVAFQVGIDTSSNDKINVKFANLTTSAGLSMATSTSVSTAAKASAAITKIDSALNTLSQKRATYGAAQNRLESAVANIQSMRTNLAAANSRIRDVDVAEETSSLAKQQVLSQAGAAILAQANGAPQLALSLLRG